MRSRSACDDGAHHARGRGRRDPLRRREARPGWRSTRSSASAATATSTTIPTGRLLRDAKLYEIGAGTSEIRRMLIGREIFEKTAMTTSTAHLSRHGLSVALRPDRAHERDVVCRQVRRGDLASVSCASASRRRFLREHDRGMAAVEQTSNTSASSSPATSSASIRRARDQGQVAAFPPRDAQGATPTRSPPPRC